jgi:hypothetical protein
MIRALPAVQPNAAAHGAEHWDTLAPWSKYSSDVVLVVHHILTEPAVPTATVRFELPERAGSGVLGHCAADTVEEAVMGAIDAAQAKLRAMSALPAAQPDLTDPNVVHANMLRGTIAKPTVDQIRHIYGDYGDDLPDAAAIREAALREASEIAAQEGWPSIMSDAEYEAMTGIEEGSMNCATRIEAAILALIDNPGKEVMPDEARTNRAAHDIGPGDQAVAGAAQKGDSHE